MAYKSDWGGAFMPARNLQNDSSIPASQVVQSGGQNLDTTASPTFVTVQLTGLTANMPVQTNTSETLVSTAINLAGGTTQVTGILPVANGGTGSGTTLVNGSLMVSSGGKIIEGTSSTNPTFTGTVTAGTLSTNTIIPASGSLVTVSGDVNISGTVTYLNSQQTNIKDSYILINSQNTLAVSSGGLVINTSTGTGYALSGNFVAGVSGTSNPTVGTTLASGLAVGNLILIIGSTDNDGIYEVLSHAAGLLTIRGVGLTATVEPFTANQFHAEVAAGIAYLATVTVLRSFSGSSSVLQVSNTTNITPLTYTQIATLPITLGTQTTGTLPVTQGGTGSTSFTGSSVVQSNSAGTALTTGPVTNAQLQNDSITVTAGSGMTGGGTVTLGGTTTLSNAGVTSANAGTGISITPASTGVITVTNTGVTSLAAGTGISVSAATGASTVSLVTPVPVVDGGTGSTTALTNNKYIISSGGAMVESAGVYSNLAAKTDIMLGNNTYTVGTASAGGTTTVTGVSTSWSAGAHSGGYFVFSTGQAGWIVAVVSATSLIIDTPYTVASTTYTIYTLSQVQGIANVLLAPTLRGGQGTFGQENATTTFSNMSPLNVINPALGGPALSIYNTADQYPHMTMMPYGASVTDGSNNHFLTFDAFYNGAWTTSSATSSFMFNKQTNDLSLKYYSSGAKNQAITWSPAISWDSSGRSYVHGDAAALTSLVALTSMNVYGTNSNQSTGPHIQTYTAADNYPLLQILSDGHDNISLGFDAYYNQGTIQWESSNSTANFQIYKYTGALQFNYDSGKAQGAALAFAPAMSISKTGVVNIGTPGLTFTNAAAGYSATALTYYEETTWTPTLSGCVTGSVTVSIVRVGKVVTMRFPAFTAVASSSGEIDFSTGFPARFVPTGSVTTFLVSATNNGLGWATLNYATSVSQWYMRFNGSSSGFTSGATVGWPSDIDISYSMS